MDLGATPRNRAAARARRIALLVVLWAGPGTRADAQDSPILRELQRREQELILQMRERQRRGDIREDERRDLARREDLRREEAREMDRRRLIEAEERRALDRRR